MANFHAEQVSKLPKLSARCHRDTESLTLKWLLSNCTVVLWFVCNFRVVFICVFFITSLGTRI